MPIHTLTEEVSSAIAAGEVVERPASVVKELLENAVDAKARTIEVRVRRGGKGAIEVSDDGEGIPADELTLAVARYSTSKLESVEDLGSIRTLGFRGEALASIGAVSRMEIITRAQGSLAGSRLTVDGGKIGQLEPVGAPPGTVVRVQDLFFNVPARRRFLKSDTTEQAWITRLMSRYAMAYPDKRIGLETDAREGLRTSGSGDRAEVLAAIYGLQIARDMIPLVEPAIGRAGLAINGYISPPSVNRSNRREITLFVNGRWIQDVSLGSAVTQAYHGLIMVGRYPIVALFLELPPGEVDVNVHPAKAEVRLADPNRVFSTVQRAVRASLIGQAPVQTFAVGRPEEARSSSGLSPSLWAERDAHPDRVVQPVSQQPMWVPILRSIGQVGATYLVAEGPDGIYLIDQHAAHERVLFERLMRQVNSREPESQALLESVTVELGPLELQILEEHRSVLTSLGFQIEPFGPQAYRVRAVPAAVSGISPDRALRAVVEDFEENEAPLAQEAEARIAARVCKRAAIKAGQVLSLEEQRELVRDLERCSAPRTCPHGRPTMIHLSVAALERQFGRRG
ncbi:MAG: DNA mismatch repair endonuclease MutL [Chloroflexota bacterium]|mgnify:FL=1